MMSRDCFTISTQSPVNSKRRQDLLHGVGATLARSRGTTKACTIAIIAVRAQDKMRIRPFDYVFDQILFPRTISKEEHENRKVVVICCLSKVLNEFGVRIALDSASFDGISKEKLKDAINSQTNKWNTFLKAYREQLNERGVELDIRVSLGCRTLDILWDEAEALEPLWVVICWSRTCSTWSAWSDHAKRQFQEWIQWKLVLLDKSSRPLIILPTAQQCTPDTPSPPNPSNQSKPISPRFSGPGTSTDQAFTQRYPLKPFTLAIRLGDSPLNSDRRQNLLDYDSIAINSAQSHGTPRTYTIAIAVRTHDEMRMEPFAYVLDHLARPRTFAERQEKRKVVVICCMSRVQNEFKEIILDGESSISKVLLENAINDQRGKTNHFLKAFRDKLNDKGVELHIDVSVGRSSIDVLWDAAQAFNPLWMVIDWPETVSDWATWSENEKREFKAGLSWNLVLLEKNSQPLIVLATTLHTLDAQNLQNSKSCLWNPTRPTSPESGTSTGIANRRSPLKRITPPSSGSLTLNGQSDRRRQSKPVTMTFSDPGRLTGQENRSRVHQSVYHFPVHYEAALAMAIEASIFSASKEGIRVSPSPRNSSSRDGGGGKGRSDRDNKFLVNFQYSAGSSDPLPANQQQEPEDKLGGHCVVCWDAPVEAVCIPCGHLAGCKRCLTNIETKKWGCPVCRAKIKQVVRVYAVSNV